MSQRKKSKIEWIIIISLTLLFASVWLLAHWNLSRQPPYHKGPKPRYQEPTASQKLVCLHFRGVPWAWASHGRRI